MLMLYVFLVVSILGAVLLTYLCSGFVSPAAVWQIPLFFVGLYLALTVLFLLIFVISCILVDKTRKLERPNAFFRFMAHQVTRVLLFFAGVRVHVTGLELLPRNQRFLLVSNHLFAFDPVIFYYTIPHQVSLSFLSKKENDSIFIVSQFMHEMMCLPIDRENDRAALKTILKTIELIKNDVTSFAVFPEGYTSKDGKLHPFRNGVFKVAQKANVPIVVCVLKNTRAILKNMFLRPTDVYLDFLAVIPAEELSGVTTAEIGSRVHLLMEQGIAARETDAEKNPTQVP